MITEKKSTITYRKWDNGAMREFSEEVTVVRMDNGAITYACGITQEGYLLHCYFGAAIGDDDISYLMRLSDHPYTPNGNNRDRLIFMDSRLFEFPCHGTGDYREPCLMVLDEDGMSTCDLRVTGYRTVKGKPALKQKGVSVIPATYAAKDEAETLVITLEDAHLDLTAELTYTMFTGLPVVTRSARVINHGYNELRIQRLLSGCVEWDHSAFDMITLTANGVFPRTSTIPSRPLCPMTHRRRAVRPTASTLYTAAISLPRPRSRPAALRALSWVSIPLISRGFCARRRTSRRRSL